MNTPDEKIAAQRLQAQEQARDFAQTVKGTLRDDGEAVFFERSNVKYMASFSPYSWQIVVQPMDTTYHNSYRFFITVAELVYSLHDNGNW